MLCTAITSGEANLKPFITTATKTAQFGTISAAAGLYHAMHKYNPFSAVLPESRTLLDAVMNHNLYARQFSPRNSFGIDVHEVTGRWYKNRSPFAETEVFCIANMIGHMRAILGSEWAPPLVEVSLAPVAQLRDINVFRNLRLKTSSTEGPAVHIPINLMFRTVPSWRRQPAATKSVQILDFDPDKLTFSSSMQLLLRGYAKTGKLTVETAAIVAGMSQRTLQRRLKQNGLTFSELADRVRYDVARELLAGSSDISITDASYQLGYGDPGSFTRAFRRFAGTTPSTFRNSPIAAKQPPSRSAETRPALRQQSR